MNIGDQALLGVDLQRARVIVRGEPSCMDVGPIAEAALTVLACRGRLVLQLDEVPALAPAIVTLCCNLAAVAAADQLRIVLEVAVHHLAALDKLPLSGLLRVETTETTMAVRRAEPPPMPERARSAQPHRRGRGFVASYGVGRRCTAPACATWLSRYNPGERCAAHPVR